MDNITATEYLKPLIAQFVENVNPQRAEQMKRYLKGHFEFYGMDSKTLKSILKSFFAEYGWPARNQLFDIVWTLWELSYREFQYTAFLMLQKFEKKLVKEDIEHIEKLIITKSWWDSVDGLSTWTCGSYFKIFPDQIEPVTSKWMATGNIWLQRTCLLFQLKYKMKTDTVLLAKYIMHLKAEKEFFIRKAIGWILREYSKVNPDWVRSFVSSTELSGLSRRVASKYI